MSAVKPILRAVKLGTKQIDEVATAAAVSRAPVTRGLAADAAEELRRIEADEAAELGYTQQQMDELDADVMDIANSIPEEPKSHSALFKEMLAEHRGEDRVKRMQDTKSREWNDEQSMTPEEYQWRMQNQFDDVDFRATQGMNRGGQDGMQIGPSRTLPVEDIEKSMKRDKVLQDMFNSTVLAGPRAKQRVDAWGGADVHRNKDGSYRLYWHTEQNTDQSGNLPQFGNPREGGVHSGTNQAAEQASFGLINHQDDLDSMIEGRAALEENLRQVFGLADMDVQKGMNTVGKTMRQYIARKFNDQSWMPTGANFDSLFNDLKAQLGEALKRLDADPNAASRYMGKLKDVDTPSTVPHLFKGKNGFYWHDGGGYSVESFNAKLQETWPDEADKIQRLYEDSTRNIAPLTDDAEMWGLNQAATTAEWKALQGFLESKGFDHAWYINAVEDKGSVSIINWNPDLWMPVYEIAGNNRQQTAALQMLAAMGLPIGATGAALRETE